MAVTSWCWRYASAEDMPGKSGGPNILDGGLTEAPIGNGP